jgi:hypothetical protein
MENPKDDTLCNNALFSYNLQIQYEMYQIMQPLMKRIEQLEEKVHVMGHWDLIRPSATCKLVAAAAAAASRPQVNFVSSQMETSQKILESNGTYGPPPKQPAHNGWLRAGLRSLCEYNYDCKNYANQNKSKLNHNKPKTKKKKILVKTTMATNKNYQTY